ncbi:MAG: sugar phosphate isomerase/epimerase [Chloroflexota bacterium]|nr:sugar phosphate isomerase/epimerase [Chloroflexota bacterium]
MTNTISFISANFVARQLDYNMTRGWGQGEKATSEYFRPIETFPERFETLLRDVRDMGFEAMDLWTAHLDPRWATKEHLGSARELLERYELTVPSLAGWFGSTLEEFEATCRVAGAVNCSLLGGSTSVVEKERGSLVETLKKHGLKLGIENHPEKSPAEMLAKIGDGGDGTIGTTVDTGWYGTQGYDAARAIEELGQTVFYVHLKDVLEVGEHNTSRYGRGIVPVKACVRALERIGYEGPIGIEHEPEHFDPTEDVKASFAMLREWLQQTEEKAAHG